MRKKLTQFVGISLLCIVYTIVQCCIIILLCYHSMYRSVFNHKTLIMSKHTLHKKKKNNNKLLLDHWCVQIIVF